MQEDSKQVEPVVMDAERVERHPLLEVNNATAPGSVVLCGGNKEMIRLEPSGAFYVNGVLAPSSTADDAEAIYQAFIAWMRITGQLR